MPAHRLNRAALVALTFAVSSTALADNFYWQGGAGSITDANYFRESDSQTGTAPGGSDYVFLGAGGVISNASGDASIGRLYVGHAAGVASGAYDGSATLNVTGGSVSATAGASNSQNAGIIVGKGNSGTLNVDGSGTAVTSSRLIVVGYGNNLSQSANLNITNGATVTASAGNLNIGDAASGEAGIPGHVTVAGNLNVSANLQVGVVAPSTYLQNSGSVTTKITQVGMGGTDNSSFTINDGTYSGSGFTMSSSVAGAVSADGNSANFNGGTVTLTGAFLAATGVATNTSVSLSGNANVTVGGNMVLADVNSTATNTSLTIADNAHLTINGTSGLFVGRSSSVSTTFTMTGGQVDIAKLFLMGSSANKTPTAMLGVQSGGTLTTGSNFVVADTSLGDATYNLSNTGVLNCNGIGFVGRASGQGVMNQSGGTANFNGSLHIGDQQAAAANDPSLNSTGTYNLSGGTLNASIATAPTGVALSIGYGGNGTLNIIGGDAQANVTGSVEVFANTSGTNVGTLAFQLQSGEPLAILKATGTVKLDPASMLRFDLNSAHPTSGIITAVDAADIVATDVATDLPGGWNYQVVGGGTGKLLQFFAGDLNGDGVLNADDYVTMDRGAALHLTAGADGDLNGDGTINTQDYLLIDSAYITIHGASESLLAARESQFGGEYVASLLSSVPEPGSLGLIGLAGAGLLGRSRRRK